MAQLTVQRVTRAGLDPVYAAASAGGDTMANDGKTVLHIKNADAADHDVTIASQIADPAPGTAAADVVVSVPAGGERLIGPLPRSAFNAPDGEAVISYAAATSVTVAAISLEA